MNGELRQWYSIRMAGEVGEVSIFDQIGAGFFGDGVTAESFKGDLDKVKGANSIRLLINSPGGSVFDGMSIRNMLLSHREKLDVEVMGLAASAASVVALSGRSLVMHEGTFFMIHNPMGMTIGNQHDHEATAANLKKVAGEVAAIYEGNSRLSAAEAQEAMDAETYYTPGEALAAGFATGIDEERVAASVASARECQDVWHQWAGFAVRGESVPWLRPSTDGMALAALPSVGVEQEATASAGPAHGDGVTPEQGAKMDLNINQVLAYVQTASTEDKTQIAHSIGVDRGENVRLAQENETLKDGREAAVRERDELLAGIHAEKRNAVITSALEDGRILPADQEKWEARFDASPEMVADVLNDLSKRVDTEELGHGGGGAEGDVKALSAEERQVMTIAGRDPENAEDVAAFRAT